MLLCLFFFFCLNTAQQQSQPSHHEGNHHGDCRNSPIIATLGWLWPNLGVKSRFKGFYLAKAASLLFLFGILLPLCIQAAETIPSFFLLLLLHFLWEKTPRYSPLGTKWKHKLKYLGQVKHKCVNSKIGLWGMLVSHLSAKFRGEKLLWLFLQVQEQHKIWYFRFCLLWLNARSHWNLLSTAASVEYFTCSSV